MPLPGVAVFCSRVLKCGRPCRNPSVLGRKYCRKHGGKHLRGPASPHWKGGISLRDKDGLGILINLPDKLRAEAEALQADQEILGLRNAIALLKAREAELCRRLSDDTPWVQATKIISFLQIKIAENDLEAVKRGVERLGILAQAGNTTEDTWVELRQLWQEEAKLYLAEQKRKESLSTTIAASDAIRLVGAFIGSLRKHTFEQLEGREARKLIAKIYTDIVAMRLQGKPLEVEAEVEEEEVANSGATDLNVLDKVDEQAHSEA